MTIRSFHKDFRRRRHLRPTVPRSRGAMSVRSIMEIAPVNVSCASGYPLAERPNPIQQPASAFYRPGLPRSTRERWCRHHRLCPLLSVYRPSTAKATRSVPDRERVHIFSHLCGAHIRLPQPDSTWIVSPRSRVKDNASISTHTLARNFSAAQDWMRFSTQAASPRDQSQLGLPLTS